MTITLAESEERIEGKETEEEETGSPEGSFRNSRKGHCSQASAAADRPLNDGGNLEAQLMWPEIQVVVMREGRTGLRKSPGLG